MWSVSTWVTTSVRAGDGGNGRQHHGRALAVEDRHMPTEGRSGRGHITAEQGHDRRQPGGLRTDMVFGQIDRLDGLLANLQRYVAVGAVGVGHAKDEARIARGHWPLLPGPHQHRLHAGEGEVRSATPSAKRHRDRDRGTDCHRQTRRAGFASPPFINSYHRLRLAKLGRHAGPRQKPSLKTSFLNGIHVRPGEILNQNPTEGSCFIDIF